MFGASESSLTSQAAGNYHKPTIMTKAVSSFKYDILKGTWSWLWKVFSLTVMDDTPLPILLFISQTQEQISSYPCLTSPVTFTNDVSISSLGVRLAARDGHKMKGDTTMKHLVDLDD